MAETRDFLRRVEEEKKRWAESLFKRFPDGLGPEPDFAKDKNARLTWTNEGWGEYLNRSVSLGMKSEVLVGSKRFREDAFPTLSVEEQIEIATTAFREATALWSELKAKADQAEQQKRDSANRIAELQKQYDEGAKHIGKLDTMAALQVEEEALGARIESAPPDESLNLHKLLRIVQTRMIGLERRNASIAMWFGWAGVILGLIFGLFSIYAWRYPH